MLIHCRKCSVAHSSLLILPVVNAQNFNAIVAWSDLTQRESRAVAFGALGHNNHPGLLLRRLPRFPFHLLHVRASRAQHAPRFRRILAACADALGFMLQVVVLARLDDSTDVREGPGTTRGVGSGVLVADLASLRKGVEGSDKPPRPQAHQVDVIPSKPAIDV